MLGPKTFWVQKYYGSRKIVDLSLKNILSQTFLVPHLPYGMLLSKVGWIGRGVGVGMGVPFLGSKIILGSKNFWVHKGFWVQKKFLVPK